LPIKHPAGEACTGFPGSFLATGNWGWDLDGNDSFRDSHESTHETNTPALAEITAAGFSSFGLESQFFPVRCGATEPDASEHDRL